MRYWTLPILRFGERHESLECRSLVHFTTGECLGELSQANASLIAQDWRSAQRVRDILREIPCRLLAQMMQKAADLYLNATLPVGGVPQSPDAFVRAQSGTTGLPEHLCRANMAKNHFVLGNMDRVLDCLTRGLDLDILTRGHGTENRGVTVSYQAQTPVLAAVLPSNSPGVHTLWLPVVPLQIGLALKPGSQEPWTPYRLAAAFVAAGVPREAVSIYPGHADIGAELTNHYRRSVVFGNRETVARYRGDPRVCVHGPGFSKILFGDDEVDSWEKHIEVLVESICGNAGRGCINCSSIWASRHTKAIAAALAERIGPLDVKPPDDPSAVLAAFTVPGQAQSIHAEILHKASEDGVEDMTVKFGPRLVEKQHCAYLRPWVIHCDSPERTIANTEYMFPFVTVVECAQEQMIGKLGPTLVCTAITQDEQWERQLIDATQIDRLNIGPIPTTRVNYLQPHEGNLVDFLFRSRAVQISSMTQ